VALKIAAAIDPGSTRNSCALAVVGQNKVGLWVPLALREWIPAPGLPIDLRLVVLPEAARVVKGWGCSSWATDSFAPGETRLVSAEHGLGLSFVPGADTWEQWRHVFAVVGRGQVALSPSGDPRLPSAEVLARLRSQLATVRRTPGSQGKWQITLPEVEGAHGDLAVAFSRALWLARAAEPPEPPEPSPRPRGRSEYAGEMESIQEL
jgi:hypothetical protein